MSCKRSDLVCLPHIFSSWRASLASFNQLHMKVHDADDLLDLPSLLPCPTMTTNTTTTNTNVIQIKMNHKISGSTTFDWIDHDGVATNGAIPERVIPAKSDKFNAEDYKHIVKVAELPIQDQEAFFSLLVQRRKMDTRRGAVGAKRERVDSNVQVEDDMEEEELMGDEVDKFVKEAEEAMRIAAGAR